MSYPHSASGAPFAVCRSSVLFDMVRDTGIEKVSNGFVSRSVSS